MYHFVGPRSEVPFYFLTATVISLSRMVIGRSVTVSLLAIFINNLKFILYVLQILLISPGSVEVYPGPNGNITNTSSFAMWNLHSLPASGFSRIPVSGGFRGGQGTMALGLALFMPKKGLALYPPPPPHAFVRMSKSIR